MVMRATPSAPTSSKVRPFALLPISQVATTVFLFVSFSSGSLLLMKKKKRKKRSCNWFVGVLIGALRVYVSLFNSDVGKVRKWKLERSGRSVMMDDDDDDDELASLAHFWEVRRLSHFAKNMTCKG